jgi:hypothetical protein
MHLAFEVIDLGGELSTPISLLQMLKEALMAVVSPVALAFSV